MAIVELLLKYGADVNIRVGKYGSALKVAKHKSNWDIVQLLEEKEATIEESDDDQDYCSSSPLD